MLVEQLFCSILTWETCGRSASSFRTASLLASRVPSGILGLALKSDGFALFTPFFLAGWSH